MSGNHTCWHKSNIAANPGFVKCMLSSTVCLTCSRMTTLSSISKQSSATSGLFRMLNQYCPCEALVPPSQGFDKVYKWSQVSSLLGGGGGESYSEDFLNFFTKQWRVFLSFDVLTLVNCGDNSPSDQVLAGL